VVAAAQSQAAEAAAVEVLRPVEAEACLAVAAEEAVEVEVHRPVAADAEVSRSARHRVAVCAP
jgi:hypothetical protein